MHFNCCRCCGDSVDLSLIFTIFHWAKCKLNGKRIWIRHVLFTYQWIVHVKWIVETTEGVIANNLGRMDFWAECNCNVIAWNNNNYRLCLKNDLNWSSITEREGERGKRGHPREWAGGEGGGLEKMRGREGINDTQSHNWTASTSITICYTSSICKFEFHCSSGSLF